MNASGDPPCRAQLVDGARPDLDDQGRIARLVRDFYRDVAQDDLLGPIFAAMHVDWPTHLDKLTDFWAWQLLGQRGYDNNPLRAHETVHRLVPLRAEHYERWLSLFEEAVDDGFEGPLAELAKHRARRMARALRRLLRNESRPDQLPLGPMSEPQLFGNPRIRVPHTTHEQGDADETR